MGGVRVTGWAIDPDMTAPISIRLKYDSGFVRSTANRERTDIGTATMQYGTAHGFDETLRLPAGTHTVCAMTNNVGKGKNTSLGCRTLPILAGDPIGGIESISGRVGGISVRGWALDPETSGTIGVRIKIGTDTYRLTAADRRDDVGSRYPAYGASHGFAGDIDLPAGSYTVCVVANNVDAGANRFLGCPRVTVPGGDPYGAIDSWQPVAGGVRVSGWAIDPDVAAAISIRVKSGAGFVRATAAQERTDLGDFNAVYGTAHGFSAVLPLEPDTHVVCVAANNVGAGVNRTLGCTTVTVPAP